MNISLIRFIIAAVLIMIGILIMVIQTFGVFKLNYALNRMHAAAMGDSLGIMMIVLGMMVIYGISFASGLHHRYAAIYWPSLKSARMNRLRMNVRCRKNDWFENIIACAADHLYYRSELFKKSAGFCCYLYGI